MRKLAGYIMQNQRQAVLVTGLASAIPMLFWLAAASASLVLLRKGPQASIKVVLAALIPATVWGWLLGDPFVPLVVASTLLLASSLRQSLSWSRVLLTSLATGLVTAQLLGGYAGEAMQEMVHAIEAGLPAVLGDLHDQLGSNELERLHGLLLPLLIGLMGAMAQLLSVACLILARYWQASLYNPGGFGQEFRAIRLRAWQAGGLVLFMLMAPQYSAQLAMLVPLCAVPLAFAGLSVMHGLMHKHGVGILGVTVLYGLLLVFAQLLYPVLVIVALTDSVFDFRGLRASKSTESGER